MKANDDKTVTMPKGKKEGSQCQTSAPTRLLPTRRFPSSSPLAPRAVACSAPCLSPCARWQTKSGSRSESSWIEQKSERPRSLALFCWLRCQRRRDFASFVFFLLSSSPAPRSPSSLCERTSDVVLCRTKGLAPELRRRKRAKREGSVPFLLFLSLHLSLSTSITPTPSVFPFFPRQKKNTDVHRRRAPARPPGRGLPDRRPAAKRAALLLAAHRGARPRPFLLRGRRRRGRTCT